MYDLILRGGTCVTPSGLVQASIAVRGGRIAAVGALDGASAAEVFDVRGLHVLPGVIDPQVHFREPGLTHKEDLSTGSAAAALGGVTAYFEMPNTKPNTDSAETLAWKVARAKATSWVDFAFFVGATKENVASLPHLESLEGACGVKMFLGSSTGTLLVDDPAVQRAVLAAGRRRVACHAEDERRLRERLPLFENQTVHAHAEWRDEACAVLATRGILALARETGRRLHLLHVTTAGELPLLQEHHDLATIEVAPHHLTLSAPECYERLGTLAQMNPPVRTAHHREALWRAIRDGLVDVLGSDHAPHTLDEKARPWPQSPSGMPGVQTLLPVMLDHVNHGRLTLERLVDLTSAGVARVFSLRNKGRLAPGFDADFSVVDLTRTETITNRWIASRAGWTPYDGMSVRGWPVATIVRGHLVMREGQLLGSPRGQPVTFD